MQLQEVDHDGWDALLDRLGVTDVYWRHGWLVASAPLAGGRPVLLHLAGDGGDVVFAGLLRADPPDVVSAYGYGGPLGTGEDPPLAAFPGAYAAWCASRGVVTTFLVEHPDVVAQGELAGFDHVHTDGTVRWDLGAEDLLAGMHKHHRRLVRRAEREGLVAKVVTAPEDLGEFVTVYDATMVRNGADGFYRFGDAYWAGLLAHVPLVRVDVRDGDGALVAGTLGIGAPPTLHYHLGAVADAGRNVGASQLALLTLARHGQASGYAGLHLGGGVGGRAGDLLTYKRRFAPDGLRPSRLAKAIHDADAYRALTGRADTGGFFPAYREPR